MVTSSFAQRAQRVRYAQRASGGQRMQISTPQQHGARAQRQRLETSPPRSTPPSSKDLALAGQRLHHCRQHIQTGRQGVQRAPAMVGRHHPAAPAAHRAAGVVRAARLSPAPAGGCASSQSRSAQLSPLHAALGKHAVGHRR